MITVRRRAQGASYTKVFANPDRGEHDDRIVAITVRCRRAPARSFAERFRISSRDVGIAEQHAVTFAAGLRGGRFVAVRRVYSTFLQRLRPDCARCGDDLPVRLRSTGRPGGPTARTRRGLRHRLSVLPARRGDGRRRRGRIERMVCDRRALDDRPSAFRYPRGEATGSAVAICGRTAGDRPRPVLREGNTVALLSFGTRLGETVKAAPCCRPRAIRPRWPMRGSPSLDEA